MMPFMMPLQQQQAMAAANAASTDSTTMSLTSESAVTDTTETSVSAVADATSDASPSFHSTTTEASGLTPPPVSTDGFGLLGPPFGTLGVPSNEETPKRKRGRPPKKDVAARAKAESEKNLKQQFPMWGYGLPMPLLSGFPGMMPLGNPGAVVKDHSAASEDQVKEEIDANQDTGERPAKMAKKKPRGTGKPRGRPRTRPRPGEIIRRVKPLPIAPANYSVMYNYSLSNLAQKSAELNADGDAAADVTATTADSEAATVEDGNDENRLAPLATSLLSGEHEQHMSKHALR
ncbi:hypothetical protein BBJ29_006285 [Phytophthora kernoviae]|uniref:Uncharacterized protein n=1 Tax=Phytophthora kernoviae TaxID=325452 RepID=A0A3F2RP24_9STRA|nr:hypothetical protein BBJ29_006285 [Phytophthora kernoviae]RLN61107.1 hypothetical protein BBP00_00005616 [Phytophthora kernoviae]